MLISGKPRTSSNTAEGRLGSVFNSYLSPPTLTLSMNYNSDSIIHHDASDLFDDCPDERIAKPLIQKYVEDQGHICAFLPKFHCELNPIEMVWGYAKYHK